MFATRLLARIVGSYLSSPANYTTGTSAGKRKQWLIDREETIAKRKQEAREWNKKNYYGKVLTRTGRPIL